MTTIGADQKAGKWILQKFEDQTLRPWLLPMVPKWIETYHLTLMTVIWSIGILLTGSLAQSNLKWLIVTSILVFFQYITDLLDGAVGRSRNTGLIAWGFFMDHFLDYIFYASLMVAYILVFPPSETIWLVLIGLLQIGFMMESFLSFAVTRQFKIATFGIGPTEIRILIILYNLILAIWGYAFIIPLLPWFTLLCAIALLLAIWRTQAQLWMADLAVKNNRIA